MYITHDYVEEIHCIICGDIVPYYEVNIDRICENCQATN
jgi:hypothetical protein